MIKNPLKKNLVPIRDLQNIKGVDLPSGLEFLQLIVTGPPGAGKSFYINQIGGWPNEGYLDLAQKGWWKNHNLIYRPREVHLGFPYKGVAETLTVFDKEWLEASPPLILDFKRIVIPPLTNSFFTPDWRSKYIFEFLIPPAETIYNQRLNRQNEGYFLADEVFDLDVVKRQIADYRAVAHYLNKAGIRLYIREGLDSPPMRIAIPGKTTLPAWPEKKQAETVGPFFFFKNLFFKKEKIQWLIPTDEEQEVTSTCRISYDGKSFEILLGGFLLRFHPEVPLAAKKKYMRQHRDWIIMTEKLCSTEQVTGFVRIKMDESILLGRDNRELDRLFDLPDTVGARHLSITNTRGDLILTPLDSARSVKVLRMDHESHQQKVERDRHQALTEIKRLYGQDIQLLGRERANELLEHVNGILSREKFRPRDNRGKPGGLLELPTELTPVIVGDLHGRIDNFLKILSIRGVLKGLRKNTVCLIILGDAIHSEIMGELEKMHDSTLMMDLIFTLKFAFPQNVFYIRGNHDSFSQDISKNGVLQGVLHEQFLTEIRGEDYVGKMRTFFNSLPYIAYSENYICCHAAPPREEVSKKDLVNINNNHKLIHDITTKRLATNKQNKYGGYSKGDVKRLRKTLKVEKKTPVIVGHTPLDPFGSVWQNAGNVKNHHILYSAHQNNTAIFFHTGKYLIPLTYPTEPLQQYMNQLP